MALAVVGGGAVASRTCGPSSRASWSPTTTRAGHRDRARHRRAGAGGVAIARGSSTPTSSSRPRRSSRPPRDPKSAGIQPGVYELREQMRPSTRSPSCRPGQPHRHPVTIPEGLWATEIYARLSKATGIPWRSMSQPVRTRGARAAGLGEGQRRGLPLPGELRVRARLDGRRPAAQMVAESTKRLEALGVTPDQMERVVITASIVEGEARSEDRAKVARVVENRLAQEMRLQLDSTVNYAPRSAASRPRMRTGPTRALQHLPTDGAASRARSGTRARARSRPRPPRLLARGSSSSPSTRPRGRPSSPSPTRSTSATSPSSRSGARPTRASAERGGRGVKCCGVGVADRAFSLPGRCTARPTRRSAWTIGPTSA